MRVARCAFGLLLSACGADWHLERGEAAVARMDLPAAERSFRAALEREPDRPDALYGLGWTYHLAGESEQAKALFERCVEEAPRSALGFKGLGSVALAEGQTEVARQRFEEALQRAPGDPAILNSQALLELHTGNIERALGIFRDLVAAAPRDPTFAAGLAEALLRNGQVPEALAQVDLALAGDAEGPRERVVLHTLRARLLLTSTAGRLDASRCAETAPPLLAWLDEADAEVERAMAFGLAFQEPIDVRRQLRDRRRLIARSCPDIAQDGATR